MGNWCAGDVQGVQVCMWGRIPRTGHLHVYVELRAPRNDLLYQPTYLSRSRPLTAIPTTHNHRACCSFQSRHLIPHHHPRFVDTHMGWGMVRCSNHMPPSGPGSSSNHGNPLGLFLCVFIMILCVLILYTSYTLQRFLYSQQQHLCCCLCCWL